MPQKEIAFYKRFFNGIAGNVNKKLEVEQW